MTARTQTGKLTAIQDRSLEQQKRVTMIRDLTSSDDDVVLAVLIDIAQDEHEPEAVTAAAGATLAESLIRTGAVDDIPLHDFSGPAYLAFDAAIAMHQRA